MADVWGQVGAIAAVGSALIAGAALWVSLQVYRRQRQDPEPALSIAVQPCTREPALTELIVLSEHRGSVVWALDWVDLISEYVRAAPESEVVSQDFDGAGQLSLDRFLKNAKRDRINLGHLLPTAGTAHAGVGRQSYVVFFRVDPAASLKTLSIRLSLSSMDAKQRRRVITVKRTLPAIANIATA